MNYDNNSNIQVTFTLTDRKIMWPGGSPPQDSPECGFDNEKCPPESTDKESGKTMLNVVFSLYVISPCPITSKMDARPLSRMRSLIFFLSTKATLLLNQLDLNLIDKLVFFFGGLGQSIVSICCDPPKVTAFYSNATRVIPIKD